MRAIEIHAVVGKPPLVQSLIPLSSTPSRKVKSIKHKFSLHGEIFHRFKASLHGGIIVKQYEHVTKSISWKFLLRLRGVDIAFDENNLFSQTKRLHRDFAMANKASDKSQNTFADSRICSVTTIPRRAASDRNPRLWHLCPRNDVLHENVSVWQQSFTKAVVSSASRLIKLLHAFLSSNRD